MIIIRLTEKTLLYSCVKCCYCFFLTTGIVCVSSISDPNFVYFCLMKGSTEHMWSRPSNLESIHSIISPSDILWALPIASLFSLFSSLQVVQNIDDLFERDEFAAAPDAGWPDCFNSGVFVFRPSLDTYQSLLQYAMQHGSFDG